MVHFFELRAINYIYRVQQYNHMVETNAISYSSLNNDFLKALKDDFVLRVTDLPTAFSNSVATGVYTFLILLVGKYGKTPNL